MAKKSPEEVLALRKLKEQKELAKIEKETPKVAKMLRYFSILVIILTIVYVADEIASNIYNTMKPYMIFDLFNVNPTSFAGGYSEAVKSEAYGNAVSWLNIATIPTFIVTFLLPLYKMLPDRFGRKIFLVINTVGMGIGLLICMVATHPLVYVIGMVVVGFFTPNDIQVIYIMEVAPQKHRAKLCSITKGIALLSVSLIGVLKSLFYTPANPRSWQLVFLIPVIITIIIGLSCLVLTRETPVYLNKRREYLMKSEQEREEDKKKANAANSENGGIKAAFKYIFHSKQLTWLFVVLVIFEIAVGLKGYEAETILAHIGSVSDEVANSRIDMFYIVEPIVYAIFAFFSGFLSDWLGRKLSCIIFGLCAFIGQLAFILLARAGASIILISIANGLMYGGLWSLSDCLFFVIPAESTPTNIRSSVTGLITYTGGINMIVGMLLGVFFGMIGSANISMLQLFTFVPFLAISIIIFALKVKETAKNDMNNVNME